MRAGETIVVSVDGKDIEFRGTQSPDSLCLTTGEGALPMWDPPLAVDIVPITCTVGLHRILWNWVLLHDISETRGGRSITNSAETVCSWSFRVFGARRIAYLDSDKGWWELVNRRGEFTTFAQMRRPCAMLTPTDKQLSIGAVSHE
jgi:hypothetical protein